MLDRAMVRANDVDGTVDEHAGAGASAVEPDRLQASARSSRNLHGASACPVAVANALPEDVVDNAAIAARLGVDEAWIERRTGTRVRHVARPGDRLERFAAAAADAALGRAGIAATSVDTVLVATTSAEEMSPHAAPLVAADIGASGAAALDVSCACVGFIAALTTGAALIESGRAQTVVVVGADLLSRYLDHGDPQSAMLFGDGAGAVVLVAGTAPAETGGGRDRAGAGAGAGDAAPAARVRRAVPAGPWGVGPSILHSDGSERGLITLDRTEKKIRMDGPAVFRYAVRKMSEVTGEVLASAGLTQADVDLFVYHQANGRIIEAVGRQLQLEPGRVVDVVGRYANTSAASVPIALSDARAQGRLEEGMRLLLVAFGAGMVWGGTALTWGRPPAVRSP